MLTVRRRTRISMIEGLEPLGTCWGCCVVRGRDGVWYCYGRFGWSRSGWHFDWAHTNAWSVFVLPLGVIGVAGFAWTALAASGDWVICHYCTGFPQVINRGLVKTGPGNGCTPLDDPSAFGVVISSTNTDHQDFCDKPRAVLGLAKHKHGIVNSSHYWPREFLCP